MIVVLPGIIEERRRIQKKTEDDARPRVKSKIDKSVVVCRNLTMEKIRVDVLITLICLISTWSIEMDELSLKP